MTNSKILRTVAPGLLFLFSLTASISLHAAEPEGEMLAQAKQCNSCHALTESLIGPPYIAIAARHASEKEVMVKVLTRKIIQGGGGTWGVVPMVPNEHVSEDEAQRLASWILSQ